MNSETTARNLCFGLLALEEQLIGAEDLQTALGQWLLEPSTPLSAILVREQLISEPQCERIGALVDARAEDDWSGGQATESVDFGLLASVRDALGRLGDAGQDANVEELLEHLSASAGGDKSAADGVSDDGDRFEILGEHARGGLGEVLLARDKQLNRRVALKQIRERWAHRPEYRERFLQEAEFTGRLEHPGVVPVYAMGKRADGRLYYAMRLIRGESLEQAIRRYYERRELLRRGERSVQFRQLLRRFVDVCNTIDYAHSRGVLHRDIKPANIMLGKYGETLIVDWGLAKNVDVDENALESTDSLIATDSASGSAPTMLGSAVGTPHYMSPEQAAGRIDQIGTTTDVFCLGATLYQLLTGRPPQTDSSLPQVLERIQQGEFPRPTELQPGTPKPLEAICLKAMAMRPLARYFTAGDLASDVERWLADEPVTVYRDPRMTQWSRAARRHPARTASAVVTFLLLCIVAVAANFVWQAAIRREAEHQAELREQEFRRDLEREQAAARRLAVAEENLQSGREELRAGRFLAALRLFQAGHDACRDDERLDDETRAEIAERRVELAKRLDQVQRLVDFQRLSDEAMFTSFFEMDRHSMILFEAAFERLGVFEHSDWWAHLPTDDLNARDADRLVRQVHFQLAMLVSMMSKNFVSPELLVRRGAGLPPGQLTEEQQLAKDAIRNGTALAQHYRRGQWVAHLAEGTRYLVGERPTLPTPPTWRGDNYNDCYCVGSTCMIQVQVGDAGFMRQFLNAFLGIDDVRAAADELLEGALALRPDEYWANFSIGTLRRQERQFEAARRAYTQCITIRPDIPLTYNLRGLCAYEQALTTEQGEPQRSELLKSALADAVTAHQLDPDVEFNHWLRGFIYQQLGLHEDAAAAMLSALHREIPADMVSSQRWAVSVLGQDLNLVRRTNYVFRDRFADAAQFAQERLADDPKNLRLLALLATAELASGRNDEALAAVARVTAEQVAQANDHAPPVAQEDALRDALLVQAEVQHRRGEFAEALKLFNAVRVGGTDPARPNAAARDALAAEGLAKVLEQQAVESSTPAANEQALASYDEYVRAAQTDWQQIRSRLGRCRMLLRLDREEEAVRTLDDALQLERGLDTTQLRELALKHAAKSFLFRLDALRPHVQLAKMWMRLAEQYPTLSLRNGGFELGLSEYWSNRGPAAPMWWNQNGCRSTAEVTTKQRRSGDAALHIIHDSPRADARLATTEQVLPAEAGRRYRVSLWAKANSLEQDAVRILVDDQKTATIVLPAGSYDWRELSGEFVVTGNDEAGDEDGGVRDIRLQIISQAPGESWLDDLRIDLVSPAPGAN